jgi:hypothetical protein
MKLKWPRCGFRYAESKADIKAGIFHVCERPMGHLWIWPMPWDIPHQGPIEHQGPLEDEDIKGPDWYASGRQHDLDDEFGSEHNAGEHPDEDEA